MEAAAVLTLLEEFAAALFFELDCRYGLDMSLERDVWPIEQGARERRPDKVEVRYPKNRYSTDAVTLYMYGRTIENYPLLQYLAYYQVLEHFFPAYAGREVLQRVRLALRDPVFDLEDDLHMSRVLAAFRVSAQVTSREIEQLKLLLSGCVVEEDLKGFLQNDTNRREFLTDKRSLQGVRALALDDRQEPLAHQIAARVYAIRNRIVHAKEDGGGVGAGPLLPTSTEARRLTHDVALCRLLARSVLIANSHAARW